MTDYMFKDFIRKEHTNWNFREMDSSGEKKGKDVQSSPTITPQLQSSLMS